MSEAPVMAGPAGDREGSPGRSRIGVGNGPELGAVARLGGDYCQHVGEQGIDADVEPPNVGGRQPAGQLDPRLPVVGRLPGSRRSHRSPRRARLIVRRLHQIVNGGVDARLSASQKLRPALRPAVDGFATPKVPPRLLQLEPGRARSCARHPEGRPDCGITTISRCWWSESGVRGWSRSRRRPSSSRVRCRNSCRRIDSLLRSRRTRCSCSTDRPRGPPDEMSDVRERRPVGFPVGQPSRTPLCAAPA